MTNVFKTVSAAALAAALAMPAFAQDVPLNSTVSGGQGDVSVDGQILQNGDFTEGLGFGAAATVFVIIAMTDDDETSTTTTTTP